MSRARRQRAAERQAATAQPGAAAPPAPEATLRTRLLAWGLLVVLAAAPYLGALRHDFVLDDLPIIVENPLIQSVGNLGTIFGTTYWGSKGQDGGLYRPLTIASYAFNHAVSEYDPGGYRLVNIALHAGVTLLLFALARSLLGTLLPAFAAAALFAVHPIHTEAVTGIVGRAEVLAALFFLAALLVARTAHRLAPTGAGPLYLLGLLSKETAVTLPGVALAGDLLLGERPMWGGRGAQRQQSPQSPWRRRIWTYAAMAAGLAVFLAMRSRVVVSRNMWAPWRGVSEGDRILTALRVLAEYLGLLVWPHPLSADYWRQQVPIASSPAEPGVVLALVLFALLGALSAWAIGGSAGAAPPDPAGAWRRSRVLVFGIAWFFLTIFPVSNIPFGIGVGKAERLLYLPSAGFCLAVGAALALAGAHPSRQRLAAGALAAVVLVFAGMTHARNRDWKDTMTLASATLATAPDSPLFSQIAALQYRKDGDAGRAVELLRVSVRELPHEPSYHFNLGNALLDLKRWDEAIASYREALRLKPDYADALNNLAQAEAGAGRHAGAAETLTRLLALDGAYRGAYVNLASAYYNDRRLVDAERTALTGLARFPDDADLLFNLAVVQNQLGKPEEARKHLDRAVALKPELKGIK